VAVAEALGLGFAEVIPLRLELVLVRVLDQLVLEQERLAPKVAELADLPMDPQEAQVV
jgi:hypothetical protein